MTVESRIYRGHRWEVIKEDDTYTLEIDGEEEAEAPPESSDPVHYLANYARGYIDGWEDA